MVTTQMNEQIQYAAQAPEMIKYICKVHEWTEDQFKSINMRGVGRAKKRLTLYQSIRTSKMMFDWLNVGKQKQKMHQDGTCPCCGETTEDWEHLYHCSNEKMQTTLTSEGGKAEEQTGS